MPTPDLAVRADLTVVHVAPPSIFLPFVAGVFEEAAPSASRFLVYGEGRLPDLPVGVPVERVGTGVDDRERLVAAMSSADVAIVHSMSSFSAEALAEVTPAVLRVWSGWGGEYSGSRLDPTAGLVGSETADLVRPEPGLRRRVGRAVARARLDSALQAAARATDVFSAPVPTDLDVFRRRFTGFRGRYHQLNYASVEDTYATLPDRVTGPDVLVGNSATPENNHLEMFRILAKLDLGARRVVVPLSYGDAAYAEVVEHRGREFFGDRFVSLRGFLPLHEYNAVLASCGVVVMGHRRQQALGNIARAVWQGAEVYLDPRSPILAYFRQVGVPARALDSLVREGLPAAVRSDEQVASDRQTARSIWGRDVAVRNVRGLLTGL